MFILSNLEENKKLKIKNKLFSVIAFKLLIALIVVFFVLFLEYFLFFNITRSLFFLKVVTILISIFLLLILEFDYKLFAFTSLIFVLVCPVLILIYYREFSNFIALNIPFYIFTTLVVFLIDKKNNIINEEKTKEKSIICTENNKLKSKILTRRNKLCSNINNRFYLITILVVFVLLFLFLLFKLNMNDLKLFYGRVFNKQNFFVVNEAIYFEGKKYENKIYFNIEQPNEETIVNGYFTIEGWVADLSELKDSKIDVILLYLGNPLNGKGKFISRCKYGKPRTDIVESFGEKYLNCGFWCDLDSRRFKNGKNTFFIFFHSSKFGWKYDKKDVIIKN